MTFQQMAAHGHFERSVTWWNKMAWEQIEDAPRKTLFPGFAKVLGVTERRVAEMVAEQWCGVRPDDTVPERLRTLVAELRGVNPDDLPVIEMMAKTLSEKWTAELEAERLSARGKELEETEEPYTQAQLERLNLGELQTIAVEMGHSQTECEDRDEAAMIQLILEGWDPRD
ncbi:hypothetical protein OH809_10025 [Streptomyces sp. NBC_00873]|uniref:hypothetical protein n=1 Tax=unclassified Streptomyces TaxID=2593676 RepID=UPI003863C999|nr:hypothetical protein OH809_10025 [Streptomyces sp. NBC_00873]WTA46998.1 hypothetical protein OH821_33795 [Streptomyces sp. NBC_00842]